MPGAAGGTVATLVTHPFDAIKVRSGALDLLTKQLTRRSVLTDENASEKRREIQNDRKNCQFDIKGEIDFSCGVALSPTQCGEPSRKMNGANG